MPIITLQKRARELGRIRIGQKGDRGQPQKLDRFRVTSPAKHIVEKVAELYGGEVKPWTPAGGSPQWEVITESTRMPIMVPPQPVTQWLETWTGGAGCVHRCDGEVNFLTGEACDPEDPNHLNAKPTTRLNVVLRDVEGIGVFRLESHGWNAALELPQAAEFLAAVGGYVNGWVSLEERVSKTTVDGKPQTRKFLVPIIEIDVTPAQLMAGKGRVAPVELGGDRPVGELAAGRHPDYSGRAANASTVDQVRDLWNEAKDAGHLTEELKAHLTARVDALRTPQGEAAGTPPAAASPTPDADGVVDAEVLEDQQLDADTVWAQVVKAGGERGMTLGDLQDDFAANMGGLTADSASAEELDAYLKIMTARTAA